jgi:hypothetical protein
VLNLNTTVVLEVVLRRSVRTILNEIEGTVDALQKMLAYLTIRLDISQERILPNLLEVSYGSLNTNLVLNLNIQSGGLGSLGSRCESRCRCSEAECDCGGKTSHDVDVIY